MTKRTRATLGFDRRYEFALYPKSKLTADNKTRQGALWDQARTCVHVWNALLELSELCREMRMWWFDDKIGGPVFMDVAGALHVVRLADVLERRMNKMSFLYRHCGGVSFLLHPRPIKIEQDESAYERRHGRPTDIGMGYWISAARNDAALADISTWIPRRTATKLNRAFESYNRRYKEYLASPGKLERDKQAFFDRRGRWPAIKELAGYPRYKSLRDANRIPYRHRPLIRRSGGSGCSLTQNKQHHPEKSWWLTLQGIDEKISARGRTPLPVHDWTDGGKRSPPDQQTAFREWHGRGKTEKYLNDWNDADVIFHDGKWHISIAAEIDGRREKSRRGFPVAVRFGCTGCLAEINGIPVTPEGLWAAQRLDDDASDLQRSRDDEFPRNRRWSDDERKEYNRLSGLIAKLKAKAARIRGNTLHIWSTRLVETTSMITIIKPPIRENTKSPRGNEKNWGCEIEFGSEHNRDVLSYAPALAAQMLKYKAEEMGIPIEFIESPPEGGSAEIGIGREVSAAGKKARRARRAVKECA